MLLSAPRMEEYLDVAGVGDLPIGHMKRFNVGDRAIALYHTTRGFFASDNVCPHRGGPLAEGDLIGDEIICPWHLWGFDVASGLCTGNATVSVLTHEVRLDADRIMVRLSPPRPE